MSQHHATFARCRQAVDVTCALLGLRPSFPLAALLAALEGVRKRHIFLVETTTMPHTHTAMTIWTPAHEMICYRAGFEPAHRRLTICHELGHILGNHPRRELPVEVLEDHPDLRALAHDGQVYICGRTIYDDPIEREAEYMATYLLSLVTPTDDALLSSILQL
jgi:Zn-dependent peptidase ImmA (M78 family)